MNTKCCNCGAIQADGEQSVCIQCEHCVCCGADGHCHDSDGESICIGEYMSSGDCSPQAPSLADKKCTECQSQESLTPVFNWKCREGSYSLLCVDCLTKSLH